MKWNDNIIETFWFMDSNIIIEDAKNSFQKFNCRNYINYKINEHDFYEQLTNYFLRKYQIER